MNLFVKSMTGLVTVFLISAAVPSGDSGKDDPVALFLTWQRDPTTTMTIDWHTKPNNKADPVLRYKPLGTDHWLELNASRSEFPYDIITI